MSLILIISFPPFFFAFLFPFLSSSSLSHAWPFLSLAPLLTHNSLPLDLPFFSLSRTQPSYPSVPRAPSLMAKIPFLPLSIAFPFLNSSSFMFLPSPSPPSSHHHHKPIPFLRESHHPSPISFLASMLKINRAFPAHSIPFSEERNRSPSLFSSTLIE